jgi:hypothetical protein
MSCGFLNRTLMRRPTRLSVVPESMRGSGWVLATKDGSPVSQRHMSRMGETRAWPEGSQEACLG